MSSSDDSYVLHYFLFHLRTPLYSIKGASQLAQQMKERLPISLLDWLDKWIPSVERWISVEENAHIFLQDGNQHDWKQIVYDMAEDMQDVSTAFVEGQVLELTESQEAKMIISLALGGFRHLNETIHPILGQNFQHLMQ